MIKLNIIDTRNNNNNKRVDLYILINRFLNGKNILLNRFHDNLIPIGLRKFF